MPDSIAVFWANSTLLLKEFIQDNKIEPENTIYNFDEKGFYSTNFTKRSSSQP